MAKYINPGYGQLVIPGTQTITTHENFNYNPKFGVSLSLLDEDGTEERVNPSIPVTFNGTEIFIKFDIYIPEFIETDIGEDGEVEPESAYFDTGAQIEFCFPSRWGGFRIQSDLELGVANRENTNLKQGAVNSIWIHHIDKHITISVNGEIVIDYTDSWTSPVSSKVSFYTPTPISNLIVADEYIDPSEVIVQLDAAAVDTNMAKDGEQFKAVDSGAYILQTLDVSNARGLFGKSGRILGIAAIAAPAYTTGTDITKLKCRTVNGETITDYAPQDLSSDTSAMLAEYLPVSSDMTVASLAGLKIGWVTE